MPTILARSRWTKTAPRGSAFNWAGVRGIVAHYPAHKNAFGVMTAAAEQAQLRRWRNHHVGILGWVDIGYNYAISQAGRIYSLRGDRVGAHAAGHNSRTVGVLFMVGNTEEPTPAAQAAFRSLRARLRTRGCGSGVWGHREMSGNATLCPGAPIMLLIRSGALTGRATAPAATRATAAAGRVVVDGRCGRLTISALQRHLNANGARLKVGGRMGPVTVRALQSHLGTVVDGVVSKQSHRAESLGNGIVPGPSWEYTGPRSAGSRMVRAMQAKTGGTSGSGVWGEGTTRALQRALNAGTL
ncbi:MAG: N-acetylmuramoyl-L-alanine amidase [Brachybacterium sp.]|nr:N-acetylmuramoyl-L-alanine amidase [Brachybacterium sp.]